MVDKVKKNMSKNYEQYIDLFFGSKNGFNVNPLKGINYDDETLTYMTSDARSKQITKLIKDRMFRKGYKSFNVLEICAGIGGNTLTFACDPCINKIVAYEKNEYRRTMLDNNLTMYKCKGKVLLRGEFSEIPSDCTFDVIYVDPPWLPSHISGIDCDKNDYISKDICIGDITMSTLLNMSTNNPLIVYRVPTNYICENVKGYTYEKILIKNSLVIFAHRNI